MLLALERRLEQTERLVRSRQERGDHTGALNVALWFYGSVQETLQTFEMLERVAMLVRDCLRSIRPWEAAVQVLPLTNPALHMAIGELASRTRAAAFVLTQARKPQSARPLAQLAFEIAYLHVGRDDPALVPYLKYLVDIHLELEDYATALPLLRHELKLLMPIDITGERQATLNQLAIASRHTGHYTEAEQANLEALELYRAAGAELDAAMILNNLGTLYADVGRLPEAESMYRQSLDIRRARLNQHDPLVIASLNNLAGVYHKRGDLAGAAGLLQATLESCRAKLGEQHPDVALLLNNLGVLYLEMDDRATAGALLLQALEIRRAVLGERHPDVAATLANLSRIAPTPALALQLAQQALQAQRAANGEQHPAVVNRMRELALIYVQRQDYADAALLLERLLAIQRTLFDEHHPDVAFTFNAFGLLYHRQGDYAVAERHYRQALESVREFRTRDASSLADLLSNLAAVCTAQGRIEEGLALQRESLQIYSDNIGVLFAGASEHQRATYVAKFRSDYDSWLTLAVYNPSPAVVRQTLDLVMRYKAIGAEALATQRDAVLSGRHPALAPKLHELYELRMHIGEKMLAGPGANSPEAHRQQIVELEEQRARLESELARQIPEMNLARRLGAVDAQTLARLLPAGSALIEYVYFTEINFEASASSPLGRGHYLAIVLQADTAQMIDLGEAEPIHHLLTTFLASIARSPLPRREASDMAGNVRELFDSTDGLALRRAVLDPVRPLLGNCRQLFIAPDGELNRLPFEVLPVAESRYLIDEYSLSYLGTGRDVLRFEAARPFAADAPLVVADPDFDLGSSATKAMSTSSGLGHRTRSLDRSGLHFQRLPGTRVEGEHIARALGVRPWVEDAAAESRLKACRSPRILHIATHGFFLANQSPDQTARGVQSPGEWSRLAVSQLENPLLRSGLALAGANTWLAGGELPADAQDGLLTAEDVTGMDLLATDLVVLSACETGLGEIEVGEGVFGLRRAFVLAGAKTLVMSLWKVPDRQTQELMEDYYHRLLTGQGRAAALREAQLAMKARYPDPFYWGAFICQGDPSPLPSQ